MRKGKQQDKADELATPVHVLAVEDSPSDAEIVRLMLTQAGAYELKRADCIDGASELLEDWDPDVILLDLQLPDAVGLEAVDRMRSLSVGTPLVVLTGVDDDERALESLKRGAQDYISKNDLNPRLLDRVVRHAIERQRLVKQLEAARKRVELLSRSDALTTLYNRRGFERELGRERERALREGEAIHALALDLDDFKGVNDRMGHAAGDAILKEVARRGLLALRRTDIFARIGGDEFMALLPATRANEAGLVAERLQSAISGASCEVDGKAQRVTASIGVVSIEAAEATFEKLLREVDRELYRSKRQGKNRVSTRLLGQPSPETRPPTFNEILRASDDSIVAYDMQIASGSDEPGGVGDLQTLERSLSATARLPPSVPCHLNVLPATLLEGSAAQVVQVLRRDERRDFCVAISEQQIVGDPAALRPALGELRQSGYAVALDHVGSGRACLESLLVLEPDVVKLGTRWIDGLASLPQRRRELERFVRMLDSLGCTLVLDRPSCYEDRQALGRLGEQLQMDLLLRDPSRTVPLPPE